MKYINFNHIYLNTIVFLFGLTYLITGFLRYPAFKIISIPIILGALTILISLFHVSNKKYLMGIGITICLLASWVGLIFNIGFSIHFLTNTILPQMALGFCLFILVQINDLTELRQQFGKKRHPFILITFIVLIFTFIGVDFLSYKNNIDAIQQTYFPILRPFMTSPIGFFVHYFANMGIINTIYLLISIYTFSTAESIITWCLISLHVPLPKSVLSSTAETIKLLKRYHATGQWVTYITKTNNYASTGNYLNSHYSYNSRYEKNQGLSDAAIKKGVFTFIKAIFSLCYYLFIAAISIIMVDCFFIVLLVLSLKNNPENGSNLSD